MRHLRSVLIPAVLFLLPGYASAGWVQQPSGTTANLESVYFINAQTGWVAGDTDFILRTTDGGTDWTRHTVDPTFRYSGAIRFWDSRLGFVASGMSSSSLYRSADSGVSWQHVPQTFLGYWPFNIVFVTPQKGWLVCSAIASGDGGAGFLYQTTDEGVTWALKDSSFGFMYCDIGFADSLFGMVTTDNHAVFNLISTGYIKRTTNGGVTWDTVNYGYPAYGHLRFGSPNYAWRTTHSFTPGGSHYRGVQKTTDRGGSWTTIWGGGPSGSGPPPIAVPDTLNGWILDGDTLFNTRDAGATWSWQIPPWDYLNDLFFTDSLNGWVVGGNGLILHTTDGGSGVWSEPSHLTPNASRLSVSPNPFTSFASVQGHERERFALYDISGRRVGTYRGDRIGEGLRAGVYFVRSSDNKDKPHRIVKVR